MAKEGSAAVTAYIAAAPKQAQPHLKELRALLKEVVPDAVEAVKWGAAVFQEKRILFAYAAFKDHINFVPTRPVLELFKKELKDQTCTAGSLQLPYDKPLPKKLIQRMAEARAQDLQENDARWM